MKKIISMGLIALFLGFTTPSEAQTVEKTGNSVKKGVKKGWEGTKKGAKKVMLRYPVFQNQSERYRPGFLLPFCLLR